MRHAVVVACCLWMGGCGLAAQAQLQEQMKAAIADRDASSAACKEQYPDENKDFVLRNKCLTVAAQAIRPFVTYPDLFDQLWAKGALLAEQLQNRKITRAEANTQIIELQAQLASEEQRRNLANRSVNAQESIAAAAWLAAPSVVAVRR